jgi:hypothetical protein
MSFNEIPEQQDLLVHSPLESFQTPSLEERQAFVNSVRKSEGKGSGDGFGLLPDVQLSAAQDNTPAFYDKFETKSNEPALDYLEASSSVLMTVAAGQGLLKGAKVAVAAAALKNAVSASEKVTKGEIDSSEIASETATTTIKDSAKIGVAIGVGKAGRLLANTVAGVAEGSAVSTAIDGKLSAVPVAAKLAGSTFESVANGLSRQAIDGEPKKDYREMAVPILVDAVLPRADDSDQRMVRKIFGTLAKKVASHDATKSTGTPDHSLAAQIDVYRLL